MPGMDMMMYRAKTPNLRVKASLLVSSHLNQPHLSNLWTACSTLAPITKTAIAPADERLDREEYPRVPDQAYLHREGEYDGRGDAEEEEYDEVGEGVRLVVA